MRFSVYQESHIGGRKNNQDRMGYSFTRDSLLLLLADGMGGHIQGEAAATIAVQTIGSLFQQQATPYVKKPERFLQEAFLCAHHEILRYRQRHDLPETPCTTIVACIIQHNNAFWAHCGDSRLYWMRSGQVLSRTHDHSRIESLIAEGKVDACERTTHPDRNKLFNCLGAPTPPVVDLARPVSLQAGDILLLCSDGLWGVVPDETLISSLSGNTIVRAVPELVAVATEAGGEHGDNVTALALMWEAGDAVAGDDGSNTITTRLLPLGSVTTTIQAPHPFEFGQAEAADVFNESDIENTIEEIRLAIEKSNRITNGETFRE
ncbi:MAG: PP2C family serine/threonine-protein phosphatase [Pseudomonadota bacterium]